MVDAARSQGMVQRWRPVAGCLLLVGGVVRSAQPLQGLPPLREAAFPERIGFLEEGPKSLRLLGTAVRVRNGLPFYSLGYYVNLAELRAAAGPGPRTLAELAQLLIQAKVSQGFVTRFEQRVSRERRVEFLLENLRLYWVDPGFREDAASLRSFLPFFDTGLERGEETQVWIRNGSIFTRTPGQKATRTADAGISRAFVNSYLGDLRKPGADRILRDDLLRDLPRLLEAEAPRPRPSPR